MNARIYNPFDMGMCIKNAAAEDLAREVADLTGESLTEAIRKALEERLARLKGGARRRRGRTAEAVREICTAYRALPIVDPRAPDEILAYREHGEP